MIKKINFRLAVNATLTIVALVLIYHLLIITGAIPYEATWGGRLQNEAEMLRFESFSIAMNLFILLLVLIKSGYVKVNIPATVITVFLWLLVALFSLNTVGNLLSASFWELIIFTPMTALLAIFFWRMAVEKNEQATAV